MAMIRFPLQPENNHPQYLWNEQEFIIRMLHQHKIGISMDENATQVTVSFDPALSLNFVAKGAVDFKKYNTNRTATFSTNSTFWIYLKEDGSGFYASGSDKPAYNQYTHGWYRANGDRAVVFCDPDQEAGFRCMIMDSFNCHYEYEQRIPDTGGDLVFEIKDNQITDDINGSEPITLVPGSYRFELTAGSGGRGGGADDTGGRGCDGQKVIYKLNTYNTLKLKGIRGGNGARGSDRKYYRWQDTDWFGGITSDNLLMTACGGGSSGSDTMLMFFDGTPIITAIGGAGGGGAGAKPLSTFRVDQGEVLLVYWSRMALSSAGGGGAGYIGNAISNLLGRNGTDFAWGERFYLQDNRLYPYISYGGKGGGLTKGGAASTGTVENYSPNGGSWKFGEKGQDRIDDNGNPTGYLRRDGGKSPGFSQDMQFLEDALGGTGFSANKANGTKFEIYRFREYKTA